VASDILAAILERPGFFVPLIRGGANGASFRPAAGVSEGEHRLLETRFNDAQRMTRAGSWDRDLATGKNFWSDEMFRLFGHEPGAADPTLDFFLDHVCPEDRPKVLAARQALLAGPGEVEYRFRSGARTAWNAWTRSGRDGILPGRIPCVCAAPCATSPNPHGRQAGPGPGLLSPGNPNPILRVGGDGVVEYANPAAKTLLSLAERTRIDDHGPCRELADLIRSALERDDRREADLWVARRCFQFVAAPCPEHGCANVYSGIRPHPPGPGRAALRRSQDELTARVAERTRELAEANRLLAGRLAEVQKMGKALAESERKYRGLVFGLEVGILTASGDGRVDMVNPKGLALLGLSEETILGRPASGLPLDFFLADGSPLRPEDAPLARVLLTGEPLREVRRGAAAWTRRPVLGLVQRDPGTRRPGQSVAPDSGVLGRREWLRRKRSCGKPGTLPVPYRHFPRPPACSAWTRGFRPGRATGPPSPPQDV
jgi:PAS domain-containing protein